MGKGSAKKRQKKKKGRKQVTLAALPETMTKHSRDRWDMGPSTQAQKAGKIIEPAEFYDEESGKMVNPNGVKRARRIDLVEHYHRKGIIDRRQMLAGLALRVAFEGTQRTAPAIKKVQVDSSPKPDANIEIMIDRISRFADIYEGMNTGDRDILDCVVLNNSTPAWLKKYRGPRYHLGIERMQEALAKLADRLDL